MESGPKTCVGGKPDPTAISSTVRAPRAGNASYTRRSSSARPSSGDVGRTGSAANSPTWPTCSTNSSARVTRVAPERNNTWQPTDADDVTGPGTAHTPRPSALAHAAVLAAPLRAPASTTTVAPDNAATSRLRVR